MFRDKLTSKSLTLGVGMLYPSVPEVEVFAALGLDWLWLDIEHGAFDLADIRETVRAAHAGGMHVIGRMDVHGAPPEVLRILECGLDGIMGAHVEGADDIEEIVRQLRYGPEGARSSGHLGSSGWGQSQYGPQWYQSFNQRSTVLALVESAKGVAMIDEIVASPWIDAVGIGFSDLADDMGWPGLKGHPEVVAAGTEAWRKVAAAGKVIYATVQTAVEAEQAITFGASMLRFTSHQMLAQATRGWMTDVRHEFEAKSRDAGV